MSSHGSPDTALIDAALRMLGVRRFALSIHDSCFPSCPEEDVGRGSPYSRGGLEFLGFARSLGFNTIQLGPQGKTARSDPSPYNGCVFSKSILSLAGLTLADDPRLAGLVSARDLRRLLDRHRDDRPLAADRADHALAWEVTHELLDMIHARFRAADGAGRELAAAYDAYLAEQRSASVGWLERDGVYEVLARMSDVDDWRLWSEATAGLTPLDCRLYAPATGEEEACRRRIEQLLCDGGPVVDRFAFGQFLLALQHERLRGEARRLGVHLYGDMHIGYAHQDWWAWQSLFLPDYRLGAPPSRTNPAGQPWGYPVLDPRKVFTMGPRGERIPGVGLEFVWARAAKMLGDFDGMRIDHPQGLVCPWVYRADDPDPGRAVRQGARLFSAPDYPDHPGLRPFSIVRPDQLHPDPHYPRHDDLQVVDLDLEQIDRFAVLLDAVRAAAEAAGRSAGDIQCEVLSTWPAPLKAVMQQRGMGRFCVTQKADPRNPDDVYRPEKTAAGDWIMVGNHDTKPLWLVAEERKGSPWIEERAELLARRLVPQPERRAAFVQRIASNGNRFCEAMFAELFLGPAHNVSVFFADLFGEKQLYNQPGTVGDHNWRLRVPADYRTLYAERLACGEALNIPRVLALALEARADTLAPEAASLAARLRETTSW